MLEILKLALPIIGAQFGQLFMNFVDTVVVGRYDTHAMAAVSYSTALFTFLLIPVLSVCISSDFFISKSMGEGHPEKAKSYLHQAVWLTVLLGFLTSGILELASLRLTWFHPSPDLINDAKIYLQIVSLTVIPTILAMVLRQFLACIGLEIHTFYAIVVGNIINLILNLILVPGWGSLAPMGAQGSAWATFVARFFIVAYLLIVIIKEDLAYLKPFETLKRKRLLEIFSFGLPAGGQQFMETGAFCVTTLIAGHLGPEATASHQMALSFASLTFMVPLGLGIAGTILVSRKLGEGHHPGVITTSHQVLKLTLIAGAFLSLPYLFLSHSIASLYTQDQAILNLTIPILMMAGVFQWFDGLQVSAACLLRGLGNTKGAFFTNLWGHWILGIPLGILLTFSFQWGLRGMWVGLSVGLFHVAILNSILLNQKLKKMKASHL